MTSVFYIDPQSYGNLSLYDKSLLAHCHVPVRLFGSTRYDTEVPRNVHLHRVFRYNGLRGPVLKALSYTCSLLRIAWYVLRLRPAVVHVQWLRLPWLDCLFCSFCRRMGAKTVFTAHNILPHNSGQRYRTVYARYYRQTDAIIVHTELSRSELCQQFGLPKEKVWVVPHGILHYDIDEQLVRQRAQALREDLHIRPAQMVFAMMGVQSAYKGSDIVAEAWADCRSLHVHKLLLVGRNGQVDYSRLRGLDSVFIHDGGCSDLDFLAYLELADVVLLPYRTISQSGVLLTLVDRHKPFIATPVGGLQEMLQLADVGWQIERADAGLLTEAMCHLTAHPEEVERKRTSAEWDTITRHYGWERSGELLHTLYNTLQHAL